MQATADVVKQGAIGASASGSSLKAAVPTWTAASSLCRTRRRGHGVFSLPLSFDSAAIIDEKPAMPKKPGTNPKGEFAFFNVFYEDDSQRSNRRVPSELLGGLDGDEPARAYIMEQDREISEKSGKAPLAIKRIEQVGVKKK